MVGLDVAACKVRDLVSSNLNHLFGHALPIASAGTALGKACSVSFLIYHKWPTVYTFSDSKHGHVYGIWCCLTGVDGYTYCT
jgi:hypothetical protein